LLLIQQIKQAKPVQY